MSTETLREAAALMRERADEATASPWVKRRGPGEHVYGELGGTWVADTATRQDMRHIASWHPAVALAVADWLDATADARSGAIALGMGEPDRALTVARAYLGSDQ